MNDMNWQPPTLGQSVRYVLFIGICSRVLAGFIAYFAVIAFPFPEGHTFWQAFPEAPWLDAFGRWDTGWYMNIIDNGYSYIDGEQSSVAFFPLFPLLLKGLQVLLPLHPIQIALVLNTLLFWTGLLLLHRLCLLEYSSSKVADRAVFYLAVFPASFFFYAPYTESLYLLLTLGAVFYARKGLWLYAGLFGLLASGTRVTGVVIWGILGLVWMNGHGWTFATILSRQAWQGLLQGFRSDWKNFLFLSLSPLGLIAYMLFLHREFGDALVFTRVQNSWDREFVGFWTIIFERTLDCLKMPWGTVIPFHYFIILLEVAGFYLAFLTGLAIWRTKGPAYGLLILMGILIPASTSVTSLGRYMIVLFPLFMQLAVWGERPLVDRAITIFSPALQAFLLAAYATWRFVG